MTKTKKKRDFKKSGGQTYRRNEDNLKLLVSDKEFLQYVREIRLRLNIPEEGLANNEAIERWQHILYEKSDAVLSSKEFIMKEHDLKVELHTNHKSFTETRKALRELYESAPLHYLNNHIEFLIDKFWLPLHYCDALRKYIMTGKILAPSRNFTIGEFQPFEKLSEARYIPVKIYTRLTDDEFEQLEVEIRLFERNLPQYRTFKNIDRDLEIEDWHEKRERFDIVEQEAYRTSVAEIAEEHLGSRGKSKHVQTIARDLKRTREKRFRSHREKDG